MITCASESCIKFKSFCRERAEDGAGRGVFTNLNVEGDVHWAVRLSNARMGQDCTRTCANHLSCLIEESSIYVGCERGCAAVIDSGGKAAMHPGSFCQVLLREVANQLLRAHNDSSQRRRK